MFFARFEGNPAEGECRFNPPTAVGESSQRLPASVWPTVQLSWWCGQWEKQWDPTEPVPSPSHGCSSRSPAGQGRSIMWCELMAGHDGVHRALRGAPDEVVWR